MKNGDELKSKIIEMGINEIRYKKFDNPDGPVITVQKSEVFMVKYENGTKDIIHVERPADEPKGKQTALDKTYRALIYIGFSQPLGSFANASSQQAGSANIGGTVGNEGDIRIVNNIIYFSYNFSYTMHPYSDSYYASSYPYSYPILNENKGVYHLFYGLTGIKFKSNFSPGRIYASITAGTNVLEVSGDLKDFNLDIGDGFIYRAEMTGGTSFAFCAGMGVEIKNKLNIGLRYFNSKPEYVLTADFPGDQISRERKLEIFQMVFGYEF
jgi:hypothetical protein